GRVALGAGLGTDEDEFIPWNGSFAGRRAMGDEALEIILKAWTEETVTYGGRYWQFDEALPVPKPYQQPHPPVWYAAHSQASLEYAAKHNFHVAQNLDVDEVIAEKFELYRQDWTQYAPPRPMHSILFM